jgi:hypothetical protein
LFCAATGAQQRADEKRAAISNLNIIPPNGFWLRVTFGPQWCVAQSKSLQSRSLTSTVYQDQHQNSVASPGECAILERAAKLLKWKGTPTPTTKRCYVAAM